MKPDRTDKLEKRIANIEKEETGVSIAILNEQIALLRDRVLTLELELAGKPNGVVGKYSVNSLWRLKRTGEVYVVKGIWGGPNLGAKGRVCLARKDGPGHAFGGYDGVAEVDCVWNFSYDAFAIICGGRPEWFEAVE